MARSTDQRLVIGAIGPLLVICVSWFFLDTFTVTLGSLRHGVRFYDVPAVIGDPTRMFFSIAHTLRTFLFVALCIACLVLPLAGFFSRGRWVWMAPCAPLLLMLVCGALLYSRTSGEFFATPSDAAYVSGNLIHFANGLLHRGGSAVSRHISIGVGGYLGFAASLLLCMTGLLVCKKTSCAAPGLA